MKRIVIFRNGSIGNTLIAVPLIRALKRDLGVEHVAVVVDPQGEALLSGLPYVDELFVYDRRGPEGGLKGTLQLVRKLRSRNFECAILAKRFFRNEMISYLSGIPRRIGFVSPGKRPFMLTDKVPYVEGKNIVDLNLDLLVPLALQNVDDALEIAPSEADEYAATRYLAREGLLDATLVACHFGGVTMAAEKWSAKRYGELCSRLLKEHPYKLVVFALGSEEEFAREIADNVAEGGRSRIFICSELSLKATAVLIGRAKFFLGNDSGPSHLADAVGTPAVILYGGRNDVRRKVQKWKPKGERYKAVYSEEGVLGVGVVDVVSAFEELVTASRSASLDSTGG